jgi:glycosyltransferase involved in cell wall biosynthesis
MSSLHSCPRVTLILPVYNGEAYLRPAIDSLLRQTFRDFELLIIDDGSTDGSAAIVASYADERIRFQRNARNFGLIATLNKGFELARGEFIARMDCDDISLPHRLERQLDYLACHPDVALVGSWFEKLQGRRSRVVKTPVDHAAIRFFLIFDNTFLHSSIMIRRSLLEQFNLRFDQPSRTRKTTSYGPGSAATPGWPISLRCWCSTAIMPITPATASVRHKMIRLTGYGVYIWPVWGLCLTTQPCDFTWPLPIFAGRARTQT